MGRDGRRDLPPSQVGTFAIYCFMSLFATFERSVVLHRLLSLRFPFLVYLVNINS